MILQFKKKIELPEDVKKEIHEVAAEYARVLYAAADHVISEDPDQKEIDTVMNLIFEECMVAFMQSIEEIGAN